MTYLYRVQIKSPASIVVPVFQLAIVYYGVFISQLICFARACTTNKDYLYRGLLLIVRLLEQGYQYPRLKACLNKFYGRYHGLIVGFDVSISRLVSDLLPDS